MCRWLVVAWAWLALACVPAPLAGAPDDPAPQPGLAEAVRLEAEGAAHLAGGRAREAETAALQALELRERLQGPTDPVLGPTLLLLARSRHAQLRAEDGWDAPLPALELYRRALALLPGEAPATAAAWHGIGALERLLGNLLESAAAHERGVALAEKASEPDDALVAGSLLGALEAFEHLDPMWAAETRRWALAEPAERLLARVEGRLGAEHEATADALRLVGRALRTKEDALPRARAALERALALRAKAAGPEEAAAGWAHLDLARHLLDAGDADDGGRHRQRGLDVLGRHGAAPAVGPHSWDGAWLQAAAIVEPKLRSFAAAVRDLDARSAAAQEARAAFVEDLLPRLQPLGGAAFAKGLLREHLEATRAASGARSAAFAGALRLQALERLMAGAGDEAVQHLETAQGIRRALSGAQHPDVQALGGAVAYVRATQGRWSEARAALEEVVGEPRARKGPESDVALRLWINLAHLRWHTGEFEDAHATAAAAVAALRTQPGLMPPPTGQKRHALTDLRDLCREMGRHGDDRFLSEALDADPADEQRGAAWLRRMDGDLRGALEAQRGVLAWAERIQGAQPEAVIAEPLHNLVQTRIALAVALADRGAPDEAVAELLETLDQVAARRIAWTRSHSYYVATMRLLALAAGPLLERGARAEARHAALRAQRMYLEAGALFDPRSPPGFSADLHALGLRPVLQARSPTALAVDAPVPEASARVLAALGEGEEALAILARARARLSSSLPAGHPRLAALDHASARTALLLGRAGEAREFAESARGALAASLGAAHPDTADVLLTRSDAELLLGRPREARAGYADVLAVARKAWLETHPSLALALAGTARALVAEGRPAEAVAPMREALELVVRRVDAAAVGATHAERLGLVAAVHWALATWLDVARAADVEDYEEVLRLRGRAGRALAEDVEALRGAQGAALEVLEQLRREQRRLGRLVGDAPARGWQRAGWLRELGETQARVSGLAKKLAAVHPGFRARRGALDAGSDALRRALRPGEAVVDVLLAGGRYQAWVYDRATPPARVELGAQEAVDGLVEDLRQAVRTASDDAAGAWAPAAATLAERLWAPLAAALPPGTKALLVVPDGALCAAPLELLPAAGGALLADGLALTRLSTPQDLLRVAAAPRGEGLVVFADVDYERAAEEGPGAAVTGSARPKGRVKGLPAFAALPASAAEARDVLARFESRRSAAPRRSFTGAGATERALREEAPGCSVLHLATHGYVRPNLGALLRVPDGPQYRLRVGLERHVQSLDPMLASGIALAGANHRDREGEDDGVLTAQEAVQLDLEGVDLVVLSACESALGSTQAGEGVLGLVRGFSIAGARHVVASLWRVDDAATSALMARFYEHLLGAGSPTPAEALHAAAADLRRGGSHAAARHWAAFVCYGR